MKTVLVTGGTTFVSKYVANYLKDKGYEVYVLNRNTKTQIENVKLIEGDRHNLGGLLKGIHFDVVADVTAYNEVDINDLLDSLESFDKYIMISSSAVYPETEKQPFKENSILSENKFWGKYGTDKIKAENALLSRVSKAYILRPPYLYGAMKMQFFHVKDLCRLIEKIIDTNPIEHIINVGNETAVSIKEWVELCYKVAGKQAEFINVYEDIEQRNYFSFYDYEYFLDVSKQKTILENTIPLEEGLKEAYEWYVENKEEVNRKPLLKYIDSNLKIRAI